MEQAADPSSAQSAYTVVARRYRPKSFEQLIGQEHVAQALGKAIATGRVGHAYLFTGARGVGKTSTARIFAKALNLQEGMSEELANEIASAIDSGDDIDVIEIDGASNRGIGEIRQLRANVNVRPSRAKYKIYIIDEVHMLTKEAFNALLKTLEEPPPHVKFIFCTTDPEKIPITVLSRCQRFDFAPVKSEAIVERLQEIATNEGFQCEPEALNLLARRAAGSMRDSQSLLEQVMSFSSGKITAEQVHALLGIADEGLLLRIAESLYQQNALEAIAAVDAAISGGADAGQLSEQLLNYLRDIMTVGIGGSTQLMKYASPMNHAKLRELAKAWGVQTILSGIQILDESIVRMKSSVSAVTLLEVAIVQICQLQQLASIPALIAALGTDAAQKKKPNQTLTSQPLHTQTISGQPEDQYPQTNQLLPVQHLVGKPATFTRIDPPQALSVAADHCRLTHQTTHQTPQLSSLPSSVAMAEIPRNEHEPLAASIQQIDLGQTQLETASQGDAVQASRAERTIERTDDAQQSLAGSHSPVSTGVAEALSASNAADVANASRVNQFSRDSAAISTVNVSADVVQGPESRVESSTMLSVSEPTEQQSTVLASDDALSQWKRAIASIEGLLADYCNMVVAIEPKEGSAWRVVFPPGATMPRDYCEQPSKKSQIVGALAITLGRNVALQFDIQPGLAPGSSVAPVNNFVERSKRMRELASHPLIQKIMEVLDAEIVKVIPPAQKPPAQRSLGPNARTNNVNEPSNVY